MATEHEVGGADQNRLCADGNFAMHRGWGDLSSSCRYHPTSGWGSWSSVDIPSSACGAAEASGDSRAVCEPSFVAMEDAEGITCSASKFGDDGWGEFSKSCDSLTTSWDKISEPAESPKISWDKICGPAESPKASWDEISEPADCGWDDLYDPDCEVKETSDTDVGSKCSGLTNLGNTCFMNSVLQCLTYTIPFANRMLASRHRFSCKAQEFCAMCAMESHIRVVLAASGKTVAPAFLARNLDQISRSFVPGQQQDAHEFLLFLLESMQQKCKTEESDTKTCTERNVVSELFIGQMKSHVKCKSCLHCSESVEPFLGLNLEIENCDSVREGLSNFLAVEDLQEDNKVSCSHCKQNVRRSKQLSFSKSPQILLVQLKRYKASEFFPTKIERDIKYEMSLDLAPYISHANSGEQLQDLDWNYSLYGVLVHSGWSTSSGHYYCFVQTSPGVWHCMNDSLVTRVSERTVLLQEAYILFYIRKGIKEELQLNNLQDVDDLEKLKEAQDPSPQAITNSNPKYFQSKGDLANGSCSVENFDLIESLELVGSSNHVQTDLEPNVHVACSQVKSPGISNQVINKNEPCKTSKLSTETEQPVVRAANSMNSHSPSKRSLYECEERSPSSKKSLPEPEETKLFPDRMAPSPSAEKGLPNSEETKLFPVRMAPSPSQGKHHSLAPIVGHNQAAFDSFENGSQHSYVRLLSRMPSSRRQALSSALSAQGTVKQTSSKSTIAKDKVKPVNNQLQAGMGRATSKLLQKEEHQDSEGKLGIREKPWVDNHGYVDSRKLQRVGSNKRVLASFSSGVH